MNLLPENCIAKILSFTSPRDVCRSSAVSRIFRSAADSNDVWTMFLPPDLPAGVPDAQGYPTRKDFFFVLSDHPVLVDDGRMRFWVEKSSGKKCYMISARGMRIVWGHDPRYWRWISLPEARFDQVAVLTTVWWLEMSGRLDVTLLSQHTLYAAFLVFKLAASTYGFRQPVEARVAMADADSSSNTQPSSSLVRLMPVPQSRADEAVAVAVPRRDGWLEVELGQFYKTRGEMGEVEMRVWETKNPYEKQGLILHGIEIRPIS